ncbi:TRAP transporter small permease [Marinomonas pollencensis]|uniref:TRAP transporter small permease protein n=1 Tax=Marinomonas pollencensis TaxID=491954 RepID=A0A3E0DT38_9GAMM|nr:TRAP transporter small permease subunit [Marinomonas pollencensis]REG86692.1 TRAP-type C4-dicarboxylate transport system permease small subunit [Marinomonas pollencensis]
MTTIKTSISFFIALWHLKLRLQQWVMFSTSIAFTLLVFIQVISRYIFDYSFFGIEEAASYLAIILYFIGAAYGTHAKGHISASIVDSLCHPGRFVNASHVITCLISTFLCIYLCTETWELVQFNLKMDVRSVELRIPIAWIYIGMLTGMILMAFYFFIEMIEAFCHLLKRHIS